MLSIYDAQQYVKHFEQEMGDNAYVKLSEDGKSILSYKTGENLGSIERFTQILRKHLHCDFELIWSCHASLDEIYRCRQCGTVIFGGDDEERYDPNERCPTCCHDPSVCHNEYWTAEDIQNDPDKAKTIQMYEELAKREKEAEIRRQKRGGLYDHERWIGHIKTKKRLFTFKHLCFGWGVKGMKKDRFLRVSCSIKDEDGLSYSMGRDRGFSFDIPLNFYAFYIRYIHPYSKKCPPEIRKYHFWQKATEA